MKHNFPSRVILTLTTGHAHVRTSQPIYEFFDQVIEPGIFTHQIPYAIEAILPILKRIFPAEKYPSFWVKKYQETFPYVGVEFEFSEEDKKEFWENFRGKKN